MNNHPKCSASWGIHEGPTFGSGRLDPNGYWEFACFICAREYEKHNSGKAWPFKGQMFNQVEISKEFDNYDQEMEELDGEIRYLNNA